MKADDQRIARQYSSKVGAVKTIRNDQFVPSTHEQIARDARKEYNEKTVNKDSVDLILLGLARQIQAKTGDLTIPLKRFSIH